MPVKYPYSLLIKSCYYNKFSKTTIAIHINLLQVRPFLPLFVFAVLFRARAHFEREQWLVILTKFHIRIICFVVGAWRLVMWFRSMTNKKQIAGPAGSRVAVSAFSIRCFSLALNYDNRVKLNQLKLKIPRRNRKLMLWKPKNFDHGKVTIGQFRHQCKLDLFLCNTLPRPYAWYHSKKKVNVGLECFTFMRLKHWSHCIFFSVCYLLVYRKF